MSIPFDQELTKLRLLYERADKAATIQRRKYRKIVEAEGEAVSKTSIVANDAYWSYMRRARELGYCGHCKTPLAECQCGPGMAATG